MAGVAETAYFKAAQAVMSLCLGTGYFATGVAHEPKSAPDDPAALTLALWGSEWRPVQSSGLDVVSARIEIQLRIHRGMLTEPQDLIDIELYAATGAVMAALIGDFTLSRTDPSLAGQVRLIDVLGSDGDGLRAVPGYVSIGGTMFRVQDIFIPIIFNDLFPAG